MRLIPHRKGARRGGRTAMKVAKWTESCSYFRRLRVCRGAATSAVSRAESNRRAGPHEGPTCFGNVFCSLCNLTARVLCTSAEKRFCHLLSGGCRYTSPGGQSNRYVAVLSAEARMSTFLGLLAERSLVGVTKSPSSRMNV